MKRLNGILLSHRKNTEDKLTEILPIPEEVHLPMQMHMGNPCIPTVSVNDSVLVGQEIGTPQDDFGVPIHASVSGIVQSIEDYIAPNGTVCPCVVINSDGQQTFSDKLAPPVLRTQEDLAAAARNSGCVGLGGAGFPTHIKLLAKQKIDTLVINAAECEPFITSDCRQILEFPEDVLGGIKLVMKLLKIKECQIGIEDNKPAAIQILHELCAEEKHIHVRPLPPQYPQGAEKIIVFHTTGRIVPENRLTADVGVLVLNVSTCAFLYQYSQNGIPLIQRRVTLDGDALERPCNVMAPIGTSIRTLLDFAGCDYKKLQHLISGGPMMGTSLLSPDLPLCKPYNALLAMTKTQNKTPSACIRCGKCMRACPMNLMPMELERAYKMNDTKMLEKYHLSLCMNCGCCSYVCPAHRPLAETNLLAKQMHQASKNGGQNV